MRLPDAAAARRGSPISLTALIDVVFILLLFFMLTSSFIQWRSLDVVVDNPGAVAQPEPQPPLVVRLTADGTLRFDGRAIGPDAAPSALSAALAGQLQRSLVLEPAGDAVTQQVVSALDRLRTAGATRLTLANTVGPTE